MLKLIGQNRLSLCVDWGQIFDKKRLKDVLKLAQSKMDEPKLGGKRDQSKKIPKRRAKARVYEQFWAFNPVLVNSEEFRASIEIPGSFFA